MPVMDLEMEGFSATQRTIMALMCGIGDQRDMMKGDEGNEPHWQVVVP